MQLKALLAGAALASAFTSAGALTVQTGNHPQANQSNLVFNPCDSGVGSGSGNPVNGCLNTDHGLFVSLSSNESLEISGGQATLDSTDGTSSLLTITLNGLSSVILNINAAVDGSVAFVDGLGTIAGPQALSGNGQNFFTITGITGNSLSFVTSLGPNGTQIVEDVKQIRLGQGEVTAIPEPETYALMMAGLAAVGFIARRRKPQK